jgi:hypothetical protein
MGQLVVSNHAAPAGTPPSESDQRTDRQIGNIGKTRLEKGFLPILPIPPDGFAARLSAPVEY